jgi:hypothetical protein
MDLRRLAPRFELADETSSRAAIEQLEQYSICVALIRATRQILMKARL